YAFLVDKKANKLQIKKAVEDLYEVKVEEVNTMIYAGKTKSRYTKAGYISGRKNSTKKAIVTLAQGEKIDFYSNI
ncbi:MAG TPA: 50S ribosomal protein L23, partial [Bacteroidales bacterium]|nr:50S ribosomal protein L23 [Bacteroidales bacterium]